MRLALASCLISQNIKIAKTDREMSCAGCKVRTASLNGSHCNNPTLTMTLAMTLTLTRCTRASLTFGSLCSSLSLTKSSASATSTLAPSSMSQASECQHVVSPSQRLLTHSLSHVLRAACSGCRRNTRGPTYPMHLRTHMLLTGSAHSSLGGAVAILAAYVLQYDLGQAINGASA